MTDRPALQQLLAWRLEQAAGESGELDCREIRDWLWLSAQLDGAALPRRYALPQRQAAETDADLPLPSESADAPSAESWPEPQPKVSSQAAPDPFLPTPFPVDPAGPKAAEPMARLLAEKLLPDGDAVAEELERRHGAVPLRLAQLALLPDPLRILQALRPLLRKGPHPRRRELDEERSATSSAEWRIAWPEYRPALEPRVALRVVLDGGVSMAVWEPLARELQRVLASSQAFRRVALQRLTPTQLTARPPSEGAGAATTVTLLLSDTAGHHWWDGTIQPWLEAMAQQQPLVVLHTCRCATGIRRRCSGGNR